MSGGFFSRGFRGRRDRPQDTALPPGQYLATSRSSPPGRPRARRSSTGTSRSPARSTSRGAGRGRSSGRCPPRTITVDIHCVTKWSKLDTAWEGVSVDTLLDGVETAAEYVAGLLRRRLHHQPAAGGRHRRQGLGRLRLRRRAAGAGARRARRACWCPTSTSGRAPSGCRGLSLRPRQPGLLGVARLPQLRRPVARAALLGRLSLGSRGREDRLAARRGAGPETRGRRASSLEVPGWPGHLPGQHVDVRLTAEDGYQAQRSYSIASPGRRRSRLDPDRRAPATTARSRPTSPTSSGPATAGAARPDRRATSSGSRRWAARCCWWPAARAWCP